MSDNSEVRSQARVPDDVIAAFVYDMALSTDGVRGMGIGRSASAIRQNILSPDRKMRGVRVTYEEERGYAIDINLIVAFGVSIPETAWNVQKKVHDGLKSEYDIVPEDINIHVQGVSNAG